MRGFADKLSLELQIQRLTRALRSLSDDDLRALAPMLSGVGKEAIRVELLRRVATAPAQLSISDAKREAFEAIARAEEKARRAIYAAMGRP